MNAKLKTAAISFLTMASSWFSSSAKETTPVENSDSILNRVEVKANPVKADSVSVVDFNQTEKADTLTRIKEMRNNVLGDTLSVDSVSLNADSVACLTHPKFEAAKFDMLCLIAHWENIKVRPYRLRGESFYTYGIGNTLTEDGKKVKRTDYIKDEEHLKEVFYTHVDKKIYPRMADFPLDSLTEPQICALVDIAYNCGEGVLDKLKPLVEEYCDSRNDSARHAVAEKELKLAFLSRCKAQGKVLSALKARRDFEWKVFTGEIVMKNNKECLAENEVDLYNSSIGGGYTAYKKNLSKKPEEICDSINNCPFGRNVPDTVRTEVTKLETSRLQPRKATAAQVKRKASRGR